MLNSIAVQWAEAETPELEVEAGRRRAAGLPVVDLAGASPLQHGLSFPDSALQEIAQRAARRPQRYAPLPFGALEAREAIAAWYAAGGVTADPQSICLLPGTSMGYYFALALLTRPGDDVLSPRPGYPLLDQFTALARVALRHYQLRDGGDGSWRLDAEELAFQATPRTRAVSAVSPHNPTGMVLRAQELEALGNVCRQQGAALLFDEVFSEFLEEEDVRLPRPDAGQFPLLITLNGVSKMLSLPGWKLGWMHVQGDASVARPFLAALEQLADAFLPVADLQQAMLPELLERAPEVSAGLADKYLVRRGALRRGLGAAASALAAEGGTYVCLRLPEPLAGDDSLAALELLRATGLLVHPGSWYGLPGHFVLTVVLPPRELHAAGERLAAWLMGSVLNAAACEPLGSG